MDLYHTWQMMNFRTNEMHESEKKKRKDETEKEKSKQIKCTETWVAVLGILFYPVTWKSGE